MLFADGRWINEDVMVEVKWLYNDGDRLRVQLCENVEIKGRRVKVGATRTIPQDEYFEFDDDDFYD